MNQGNYKPNWPAAVKARADIDDQLNKVLCLLAPPVGEPEIVPTQPVADYVAARLRFVRRALDAFEVAMKGTE